MNTNTLQARLLRGQLGRHIWQRRHHKNVHLTKRFVVSASQLWNEVYRLRIISRPSPILMEERHRQNHFKNINATLEKVYVYGNAASFDIHSTHMIIELM